jgi:hypothetical protein
VEATTRQLIPKCRKNKRERRKKVGGNYIYNKKDRIEGEKTKNATHIYNLQKSSTKKKKS